MMTIQEITGSGVLSQYQHTSNLNNANGIANNGETRRTFAMEMARSIFLASMGKNWVGDIVSATGDQESTKRLYKRYNNILDEALATKNAPAIDEANHAIATFKSPETIPLLVGFFEQRTPSEKTEYLEKHSPSNVANDALEKASEVVAGPMKVVDKAIKFLDDNLSTPSKIFLGAATVAVAATLICTGLGFAPFLASPVGAAFTFGMKSFGVVKAAINLQKELFSLPKSITSGFGKKDGDANFEGFPLTKNADKAWNEAQDAAGKILDPVVRNKSLLASRIKCGKESHAEITKELTAAFSDPNASMVDTMRWRLMLSDQSPSQLRDVVDFTKEKKRTMTVNKYALQDAIEHKVETDADFRSKISTGFIATKLAVKSAAAVAPLVVPGMLGDLGEHKIVEIGVDVASFVGGQWLGRKLDQMRKDRLDTEGTRPALTSAKPTPA